MLSPSGRATGRSSGYKGDMNTALDHYATLLAPVYLWMSGGLEAALAQGTTDVAAFCPAPAPGRLIAASQRTV
jgi:hypothetical protein